MRTQSEKGLYNNCLPCPNSDDQPLSLWKNALMGIKFSREFSAKCRAKPCFGRSKLPNSLENSAVSSLQAPTKWIIQEEFGRLKHNNHTRVCKRYNNLSPSCHPCHPQKRVQTPYISAFCHPDTLFSKKSIYITKGYNNF